MKQNALKVDEAASNNPSQFDSTFSGGTNGGADASGFGGGGDFTSGFSGTNASQIFKESDTGSSSTKRLLLIGAAAAAVAVVIGTMWWFLMSEPSVEENEVPNVPAAAPEVNASTALPPAPPAPAASVETPEVPAPTGEATTGEATTYTYNEAEGGPVIQAKESASIQVSRVETFSSLYVTGTTKNGQFRIPNPPPGEIYWREEGSNTVHKITVAPPPPVTIKFQAPTSLGTSGQLTWSATGPAIFYRAEFATEAGFNNISQVFTTAQQSVTVNNLQPGTYWVRIGAFNKAAGKWNYSSNSQVEVK